jgi:hypothetical protein
MIEQEPDYRHSAASTRVQINGLERDKRNQVAAAQRMRSTGLLRKSTAGSRGLSPGLPEALYPRSQRRPRALDPPVPHPLTQIATLPPCVAATPSPLRADLEAGSQLRTRTHRCLRRIVLRTTSGAASTVSQLTRAEQQPSTTEYSWSRSKGFGSIACCPSSSPMVVRS